MVGDNVRSLDVSIVVSGDTSFPELLVALAEEPFLFVLEGRRPAGFLTLSDVNKHTARLHYYFLLAGLEIAIANLVRLHFTLASRALECLSLDRQNDLRNRFRALRRKALELDELASADLSDLVVIVGATPELRQIFGTASRRAWDKQATWIPDFRHGVMHPSRPLVADRREVGRLIKREETLRHLFETATGDLRSRAPSAYTRW